MVALELKKNSGSPKLELGEIDTSSPFQSVKDALNLFGERDFSGEKPSIKKTKVSSAERVFAKETQLHLAQKELNKLKEKLENSEATKSQAHEELDRAKRTVDELTHKLKVVSESKDFITKETEEAKNQVKLIEQGNHCISRSDDDSLEQGLEDERKKYSVAIGKLDSVKQILMSVHQEYDACFAETTTAINQAAEAEVAAKLNNDKVDELSREIATLQESISQVKDEVVQVQGEEAKIHSQKFAHQQRFIDSAKKLEALREKFDPKLSESLEIQLASTVSEIVILQAHLDCLKMLTSELEGAEESLRKVEEDECSMRSLVESLNLQMENVKKEQSLLKEMETEKESAAWNMHLELQKAELELEEEVTGEAKVRGASEEMVSSLYKLVLDVENEKHEVEEMKKQAEELKKESESTRIVLEESEKKLGTALEEAEEAKTAEVSALEEIKRLSERTDASRTSTSESGAHISISIEEFESLKRKVEESDKLAALKGEASMAEVQALKASENETLNTLEAMQKEIDEMKAITKEAEKKTEMAEAARKAVEGELRRRREREQNMAVEAASRKLAETEMSMGGSSPQNYHIQNPNQPTNKTQVRKLEKARTSVAKKVLKPNLSYIFHKKRNKVEGASPSYLPGEMPL